MKNGRTRSEPFDMVVIGATGDLARRMILPSLYLLDHDEGLSPDGRIFAISRLAHDRAAYLAMVEEGLREYLPEEFAPDLWESFRQRIHHVTVSATDPDSYGALRDLLRTGTEKARVFYLATPPNLYGPISRALEQAELVTPRSRIVLEKPIGHNLDSAEKINASVGRVFHEDQVYRIDHYLGKETVQNLMALRFGNALFEPMWRSEHIDHVQITVAETLGVEGRGSYYDQAGALRDMVQNHLLQLLCLIAMEPPARLDQEAIRLEKIKVLQSLRTIAAAEVGKKTVRGQYRAGAIGPEPVTGYLDEPDTDPASQTETFVALKAEIDNWRWAGVPFYLRTGKRLAQRVSEIVIQFKRVPHILFENKTGMLRDNRLIIRLQPDESIKLGLMIKSPGKGVVLEPVNLNLNYKDTFHRRTPLAYERLLLDVIRGDATLFMHRDEVEAAWRWIEPILDGWEEQGTRPRLYQAGTWGPTESIALVVRDERVWYEQIVG